MNLKTNTQMKNLTTILATLTLIFIFSSSVNADSLFDDNRMQLRIADGVVQLLYKKSSEETVKIEIKDNNGDIVYEDKVTNKIGFLKMYDFKKLDEGYYTFEISDKEGKIKKEVAFFKRASIAMIKQANDNYRLIYGTKKRTRVWVQMLNEKGTIVFEDAFTSENGFSKVYNVSPKNTNATQMRIITEQDSRQFRLK